MKRNPKTKFTVDNDYTEPTDATLLDEALYNYFGIEGRKVSTSGILPLFAATASPMHADS